MTIGLSTYSFFWQWHSTAPQPLSLTDMVTRTADWGVTLLQICDYPAIETFDDDQLGDLLALGDRVGVAFELGTRGIDPAHLERYLALAQRLQVTLVRSMVRADEAEGAVGSLRQIMPSYEAAGVTLALETYEQIPTDRLMAVVREVGSTHLGICLDPGNSVAALETPRSTIEATAELTVNLHVKDFAFTRQAGWVGFTYAGTPLGEGLLDVDFLFDRVRPDERGINTIIEHWLVWQGDSATTCRIEDAWTLHNLQVLRDRQARSKRGATGAPDQQHAESPDDRRTP